MKEARNVHIAFIYTDNIKETSSMSPDDEDIKCFNAISYSIRLSAKITDMPCAEMNTDHFLNVIQKYKKFFIFSFFHVFIL